MDKKTLQKHYDVLSEIHREYMIQDGINNTGRNKKIRDKAFEELEYILMRFERYVDDDYELYEFLTSKDTSDYHRAIIWDEFKSFKYFGRDMQRKLNEMSGLLKEKG